MANIDVTIPKHAVDGPQHATHETDTAKVLRPDGNGGVRWGAASGGGDMYKSTYDTDDDGVVDNAEQLGGVAAADYLTEAEHTAIGDAAPHHARYTDAEAVTAILAADGPGSGLDADTVDGQHYADISSEIDGDISTHAGVSDAHHARYTDGEAVAAVLAADGPGSGLDADTVDGQHYADISSEIDGDIATHAGVSDAHHSRYTDGEAVAAVPQATTSTQGKAELATESEMDTGTDTERIITPALLRTRELDIAELLFTEDDGLLLFGPGCPMTPDAWISLRGQEAAISGAFHQVAGRWAGTRALMIEEGTTNYANDPIMGSGSFSGWQLSPRLTESFDDEHVIFGSQALKLVPNGGGTDNYIYQTSWSMRGETLDNDTVTFSVYVWLPSGVSPFDVVLRMYVDYGSGWVVAGTQNAAAIYDQWQRISLTVTFGSGISNTWFRFHFDSDDTSEEIWVDGVQVEYGGYPTSLCHGDAGSGYSWNGTPHDSASIRSATGVNLDDYASLLSGNDTWSVSFWWQPQYDSDDDWPDEAMLFDTRGADNNNRAYIEYEDADDKYYVFINGSLRMSSSVQSFSAGEWQNIVVTFDFSSNLYIIYINGVSIDSSGASLSAPTLTALNFGSDYNGANQANAAYAEFALWDRVLTVAEISALYTAGHSLTDQGAIKAPVDNLGPLAGAWPILFGSKTHTGDTSYSEAGSNQESRFGWGMWVSGSLQFEVVLKISDSGDTGYAMLQWNDSGTWRDVEGSEVSITGSTSADLVRSGVICLSPDEREYRVVIKTSDSSQTVTIYKAALICTPGGLSAI